MAYFQPVSKHDVLMRRTKTHPSKTNKREVEKRFRLIKAIREDNRNEALESIKSGFEIDLVDQHGRSALLYAVLLNNKDVVQALIEAGADVNISDNYGKTPLFYCAENDYFYMREISSMMLIDDGEERNKVIDLDSSSVASSLIEAGADINLADNEGVTPLMYALRNNERLALALIDTGADVKIIDENGRNALHYASMNGNENVVSQLTNSIDIDLTDNQGKTALMLAVKLGQTSVAAKLIDTGADVNVVDKEGKTALIYGALDDSKSRKHRILRYQYMSTYHDDSIAKNSPESVVSMLIEAGADLNIADNQGKTALIHAAQDNNENLALELINSGADVKVADNDGRTAILNAILCKNEKLIQALIKSGTNASITDVQGKTALIHLAQDEDGDRLHDSFLSADSEYIDCLWEDENPKKIDSIDYKKVASMLIEAGAEIDSTDNEGKTALIYSLQNNKKNLACALIEAGADVKTVDKSGRTALFYALFTGSEKVAHKLKRTSYSYRTIMGISDSEEDSIVSLTNAQESRESVVTRLIEAGADVSITYTKGKTALIYAVEKDDESLALALIEAGADINVSDEEGKTALIYSVQNNNEDMVSLLIGARAGADANIVDHDSKTALFYGVHNEKIVLLLINNGKASINKRDKYSRSPLFYAILKSLTSACYLLEKGSGLHRKDCYNINILSFFIEQCLRQSFDHCYMSDGLKLLQEKGIKRENIFEALINSVFCMILFTTLELQGRKKVGFLSQKPDIREIIWVLNLAKQYVSEDDDKRCETIQNIIMMMEEATDLCVAMPTILDSLVVLGANPSYADIDGNTALHYAACLPLAGASQDIVMKICHQLDELGASVHAKNHQKETPLLFCLSKKDWINKDNESTKVKALVEVCSFLLENGSSLEEATQNEKSVFHLIMELFKLALQLDDDIIRKDALIETLELLHLFPSSRVTKGVTINKRDGSLNSALHIWAMLNFRFPKKDSSANDPYAFEKQILAAIFKHLIDCGAKLNDSNAMDQTPMHLCKTWTAAHLLIKAGAKTNVLDSEGSTPLLVSVKRNQNVIDESDASCIYPDVLQKPKEFWKTVVENKLDPWTVNNDGNSVMSILVESEAFVLAKALLDVACDGNYIQTDAIAVSLLNAICKNQSSSAQWKSILVGQILKSRKNAIHQRDNEDTPLHYCCRNIARTITEDLPFRQRHFHNLDDSLVTDMMTSVHWTIVKQLLSHGFNHNATDTSGQSCTDIAKTCPALKDLLTKPLNIDEVPLVIPWKSISKTHKTALAKVARKQECRQVTCSSFWYQQNKYIQKGSFGTVLVGINEKDGREVAIKRIEKLRMHRPEEKREITSLTALADCEQVVRYLFFDEDEDFFYIVLELMEGNLTDYLGGTYFDAKKKYSTMC